MIVKVIKTKDFFGWNHTSEKRTLIQYFYYIKSYNSLMIEFSYKELEKDFEKNLLKRVQETGDLIKPEKMSMFEMLTENNIELKIKNRIETKLDRRSNHFDFEIFYDEPEKHGLFVPKQYEDKGIVFSEEKMTELSEETFEKIKRTQINFQRPLAVFGEDYMNTNNMDSYLKYYCPHCGKTFVDKSTYYPRCPHCKYSSRETIIDAKFRDYIKTQFDTKLYYSPMHFSLTSKQSDKVYYMEAHDNGISLYKIIHEISLNDGKMVDKYAIESYIEHRIGGEIKSYKILKRSKKECDPFDVLGINSKNFENPPNIVYDNAENFYKFAKNNEKMLRMIGFIEVMKYTQEQVKLEPFFIIFLGIMNKYPIMEQIVKMGHCGLFFDLYNNMKNSSSKSQIEHHVAAMEQLVNKNATKGKEALRFPAYVGDYLIRKSAKIEEYYYWRDISEITNLQKNLFEEMINSFDFAYINAQIGFKDIGNILKYGYQPQKLLSYIVNTADKSGRGMEWTVNTLADYLAMCELLDVEPDKFPMDLNKQHDDMLIHFTNRNNASYDRQIAQIGIECEKYVPQEIENDKGEKNIGVPKLLENYIIIFPKSEKDFIVEGNQQHNCVGSYPRNVRSGRCVIFFIRERTNPEKSFITAECTKSGLGQFFLSNNRRVENEDLLALGRYVANKIRRGVSSGAIHALENIH